MKNRKIVIIIGVLAVCLAALSIYLYSNWDRTPPVITFARTDVSYTEGDSYSILLEDVVAEDSVDGSVPVHVENVYPLPSGTEAKVYYIAVDSAGNVCKDARIVAYTAADATEVAAVPDSEKETDRDTPAASEETGNKTGKKDDDTEEDEKDDEPEDDGKKPEEPVDPAAPIVVLTTSRVTLKVGDTFNYMDYIKDLVDDVDSFDFLSTRISYTGTVNTAVAGTYEIAYIIIDSDWNYSEPAVLKVVVR